MKQFRTNNRLIAPLKGLKHMVIFCVLLLISASVSLAQCAMCRATVESSLSEGNVGIASKLNTGILYLFVMPYLAVAIVAYLWYRNSKENARRQFLSEKRKSSFNLLK